MIAAVSRTYAAISRLCFTGTDAQISSTTFPGSGAVSAGADSFSVRFAGAASRCGGPSGCCDRSALALGTSRPSTSPANVTWRQGGLSPYVSASSRPNASVKSARCAGFISTVRLEAELETSLAASSRATHFSS